jgi:hypothetical protein
MGSVDRAVGEPLESGTATEIDQLKLAPHLHSPIMTVEPVAGQQAWMARHVR